MSRRLLLVGVLLIVLIGAIFPFLLRMRLQLVLFLSAPQMTGDGIRLMLKVSNLL